MQQIPIYFKTDFKVYLRTEAGFAVPFRFEFYTNMPSRPFVAKFDGHKYCNCELMSDGRLCVAFDDHGFGLGKLMVKQTYYLTDSDYKSEICDRVLAPEPVINIDQDLHKSEIILALQGDEHLEFTAELPAYYQQGLSNYDLAVKAGFKGTLEEWLEKGFSVDLVKEATEITTEYIKNVENLIEEKSSDILNAAEHAATSETNAKQSEEAAASSATSASDSATASAESAQQASASADSASGSATSAEASSTSSATSADRSAQTLEDFRTALEEAAEAGTDPALAAEVAARKNADEEIKGSVTDLALKLSEDCELIPECVYYRNNGKLATRTADNYQATGFRKSDGTGSPVTLNKGDEIYVKASADSKTENLTVLITSVGGASVGKDIIESFGDTQNGKKYVATQDCEVYVSNCVSLEPDPVVKVMAYNYASKAYVDGKTDTVRQDAKRYTDDEVGKKQNILVSGTTIKTINGESILGEGNIDLNKGHWESKDLTGSFGEVERYMWIVIDGELRVNRPSDNYNITGGIGVDYGGSLVIARKGEKVEIKCGIARGDASNFPAVVVTYADGKTSVQKPVIKTYSNTEAQAGISFTAEEDIELYVNNCPDVVAEPSIVISRYVSDENYITRDEVDEKLAKKQGTLVSGDNIKTINGQSLLEGGNIEIDGINPWKGKKMLVMGASSTGRGSTSTEYPKYYSYAIRTAELLGMQLVDRTSNPRIYAAGGKAYQWKSDSLIVYTDLTETEFTTWDKVSINYYHFQEQRGDRSLKWSFVSYDAETKQLVLKKDGTNHTFAIDTSVSQPLPGLFNLGASATIAEFEASGRSDRKRESYENYLLDTSLDLVVFGGQGIEVDATGMVDKEIVPLMRRPTLDNPHFYYSDVVSLEERRNSNTGSVLYLIDKVLSVNPKARFVMCQDGNLPTDTEGREDWGLARNQGYGRFKWDAVMAVKFGIPYLNHAEKLMLNYANWSVYGAADKQHPSEEMYKWMGEMFAGELLAGTMNDTPTYWLTDVIDNTAKVAEHSEKLTEHGERLTELDKNAKETNMKVEAIGNTMMESLVYGVLIDEHLASPDLERIGNLSLHKTLPVQSLMRRCLLLDNGEVNYYLNASNSLLKEDGTEANLDGTDGQVMVEIPHHYRRLKVLDTDNEGVSRYTVEISLYPIDGAVEVPKMYVSAWEATVDRENGNMLSSVVNDTARYRGGNNQMAWDGTYCSVLGMPATSISLNNYRAYARKRGDGWNCYEYRAHLAIFWMYTIEFATLHSQKEYNAELSEEGYRQGGMGDGVTNINSTKWNTYNSSYPFIPCGYTASLGNKTGVVLFAFNDEQQEAYGGTFTTNVPSYRGIENPFGHIFKWTDGVMFDIHADSDSGESIAFMPSDASEYGDTSKHVPFGNIPRANGYCKWAIVNKDANIIPRDTGGSSTTYFCNRFATSLPTSGSSWRGLLLGGNANSGANAGLACSYSINAASHTSAYIGSRLCFCRTSKL